MKNLLFALAVMVWVFSSCKHELITPNDCPPLKHIDNLFTIGGSPIACQNFNPVNPNEFVYTWMNKICVVNFQTNIKSIVFDGLVFSCPRWGANGKIIFTRPDYNIWQVNADGTELIQLTSEGWRFGANWNKDATKFIAGAQVNGMGCSIIHNAAGQSKDTLYNIGLGCWFHDSLICGVGEQGLIVSDPQTDSVELIYPTESFWGEQACWLNNSEVIWSHNGSIKITNYMSLATESIIDPCPGTTYSNPTYNPLSNKVIWQKKVKTYLADSDGFIKSSLVIMNPDGTQEEELDIPY